MRIAYFGIEFPPRIIGGFGVYRDAISRQLVDMGERRSVFTLGYSDLLSHETINEVEVMKNWPELPEEATKCRN